MSPGMTALRVAGGPGCPYLDGIHTEEHGWAAA